MSTRPLNIYNGEWQKNRIKNLSIHLKNENNLKYYIEKCGLFTENNFIILYGVNAVTMNRKINE